MVGEDSALATAFSHTEANCVGGGKLVDLPTPDLVEHRAKLVMVKND